MSPFHSSQANELQEKFKDVEGKEMSMSSLKERVLNNENQLAALENKNKSKDRVINEKTKTIEELSESLHDKDRQVKLLQSRYVFYVHVCTIKKYFQCNVQEFFHFY